MNSTVRLLLCKKPSCLASELLNVLRGSWFQHFQEKQLWLFLQRLTSLAYQPNVTEFMYTERSTTIMHILTHTYNRISKKWGKYKN